MFDAIIKHKKIALVEELREKYRPAWIKLPAKKDRELLLFLYLSYWLNVTSIKQPSELLFHKHS